MSAQIVNLVSCCSVCPTERTNAPKWYSQFTPDIACCRYLSTGKKAILIYIVDYYDVIQAFKGQFAHFGICQTHVTNAGSCFTSYEFSQFAKDWECAHVTTSPKLSRSNGMAEDTIQTVKNVVKKAKAAQQDPMLAILYYKNMPIIDWKLPAQLLMNRRLRTKLPCTEASLKPAVVQQEKIQQT